MIDYEYRIYSLYPNTTQNRSELHSTCCSLACLNSKLHATRDLTQMQQTQKSQGNGHGIPGLMLEGGNKAGGTMIRPTEAKASRTAAAAVVSSAVTTTETDLISVRSVSGWLRCCWVVRQYLADVWSRPWSTNPSSSVPAPPVDFARSCLRWRGHDELVAVVGGSS